MKYCTETSTNNGGGRTGREVISIEWDELRDCGGLLRYRFFFALLSDQPASHA
jgi:hypothetical protein